MEELPSDTTVEGKSPGQAGPTDGAGPGSLAAKSTNQGNQGN